MIRGQCGSCVASRDFGDDEGAELRAFVSEHHECDGLRIGMLTPALPAGAELAVTQHLEDLLEAPRGRDLLALANDLRAPSARRVLASYLAHALIFGA